VEEEVEEVEEVEEGNDGGWWWVGWGWRKRERVGDKKSIVCAANEIHRRR